MWATIQPTGYSIVLLFVSGLVASALGVRFLAARRSVTASSVRVTPRRLNGAGAVIGYLVMGYVFFVVGFLLAAGCLRPPASKTARRIERLRPPPAGARAEPRAS